MRKTNHRRKRRKWQNNRGVSSANRRKWRKWQICKQNVKIISKWRKIEQVEMALCINQS
jgi:hypothetical protein